jgi:hypothetical protein
MARPLLFKSPEELESKINEYFKLCDEGKEVEELTKRGELVKYRKQIPYTLEGLADYLDIEPKTLRNYGERDEFFKVIARAKNKVHRQWVEKGLTDNFNSKVVCLCMAANIPEYRINSNYQVNVQLSLEDRLQAIAERDQGTGGPLPALPNPDVIDI